MFFNASKMKLNKKKEDELQNVFTLVWSSDVVVMIFALSPLQGQELELQHEDRHSLVRPLPVSQPQPGSVPAARQHTHTRTYSHSTVCCTRRLGVHGRHHVLGTRIWHTHVASSYGCVCCCFFVSVYETLVPLICSLLCWPCRTRSIRSHPRRC